MTIGYCIQIGDTKVKLDEVKKIVLSTFSEINQTFNNWNPDSEISQLNALPARYKTKLSPQLGEFLRKIDGLVHLTEGRFDPTIAPIKKKLIDLSFELSSPVSEEFAPQILGFSSEVDGQRPPTRQKSTRDVSKVSEIEGEKPKTQVVKRTLQDAVVGWDHIHLEGEYFWKEHDSIEIDLGGIAKGYAVDLLIDRLNKSGYQHVYVEWGGEIRTTGLHPNRRPWRIAILGGETIELKEMAIATSGSYLQNWTINGIEFTHIIDPINKKPLSHSPITSASILRPTCFEADALATTLMLFSSKEEAYAWAKSHSFKVWIF